MIRKRNEKMDLVVRYCRYRKGLSMSQAFERLQTQAKEYGIELTDAQLGQFAKYYEMLIETNKVMNLTAITELEEVIEKHFLDSIALIKVIDLNQALTVMDMGTGAGFPGIPLKIAFPNLKVVLSDSLNKRVKFLTQVIKELALTDIEAVHARAEELSRNPMYRETFDLVVSRAVANLSTLSEYCIPFTKVGGQFISYKSGDCDEEVKAASKAIQILGGEMDLVFKFDLGDSKRSFIRIKKVKNTGKKFPRKAGVPSKEPIK